MYKITTSVLLSKAGNLVLFTTEIKKEPQCVVLGLIFVLLSKLDKAVLITTLFGMGAIISGRQFMSRNKTIKINIFLYST
ncbi:Uncharacterised protein [Yersinia intermedia]|nr:Uncharacterised protein [Yersinia intermedia]